MPVRRPALAMRRSVPRVALLLLVLSAPAWPQPSPGIVATYGLRALPERVITLPDWLREASGLAVTGDGRLLTHGDERGVVGEVDLVTGVVVRAFSLGHPPVRADFEGVAIAGDRIFLSTSDGALYETRDAPRGVARFTRYDTGFGARCELEGLAFEPVAQVLLFGCKVPREKRLIGHLTLFRWSVASARAATPDRLSVPLVAITARTGTATFRPSAVEIDPRTGHLVVVAGPERAVVELTTRGEVVDGTRLTRAHRQPEGITFVGDSLLVIADEGGKQHATLSIYRRAH